MRAPGGIGDSGCRAVECHPGFSSRMLKNLRRDAADGITAAVRFGVRRASGGSPGARCSRGCENDCNLVRFVRVSNSRSRSSADWVALSLLRSTGS
jgi:hypothetical protein